MLRLCLATFLAQSGFHAFIASLPVALVQAGRADAEIGALMGSAAAVQLVASFLCGGLIDRFGGRAVLLAGTVAFTVAATLLATGIASADGELVPLVVVRVLQGVGIAAVLPAALSLVPGLVRATNLGASLALVGMAANVSLAASPPLSLALLSTTSLAGVAVATLVALALGALLTWALGKDRRETSREGGRLGPLVPAWRPSWTSPLLIAILFVGHWGVVTGYLPQRAEAAGADVGLFFTADAVAILLMRVPAGYLASRVGSRLLIVVGVAVTLVALGLLLFPPSTALLVVAGLATGAGGALILPPLTLELTQRSDEADRGSAMALYSVAFAGGVALGSLALAPFIDRLGFESALLLGFAACLAAGLIAVLDRSLARPGRAAAQPGGAS